MVNISLHHKRDSSLDWKLHDNPVYPANMIAHKKYRSLLRDMLYAYELIFVSEI